MSEEYITSAERYPLLLEGDFAVVDQSITIPKHVGLFLLRWNSGRTSVLQTNLRAIGSGEPVWWVDPVNRPHGPGMLEQACKRGGVLYTSDGPYNDIDHLASKIVGKVIGILDTRRSVTAAA